MGSSTEISNSAIKDPFVSELLDLKDKYSRSELEEAQIRQLENFLPNFSASPKCPRSAPS
jgi:predicted nuclease of restriction endonuclease-like (RecB) superfamily